MAITIVDHTPGAMTWRAQSYLAWCFYRHFLTGASLLILPWLYSSAVFIPLFNLLPLDYWGVIMLVDGLICVAAALTRNGRLARIGIIVSSVITLVLAAGLWIGLIGAWYSWIQAVGWHQVGVLFRTRPPVFPSDLLKVAVAPLSPFLPIVMTALVGKDFTVCAQPLRTPFEEQRQRISAPQAA